MKALKRCDCCKRRCHSREDDSDNNLVFSMELQVPRIIGGESEEVVVSESVVPTPTTIGNSSSSSTSLSHCLSSDSKEAKSPSPSES